MRIILIFLLPFLTVACGWPELSPKPEDKQAITLKVINYNLWHGLGTGLLKREEIDPEEHKTQRFAEQIRLLKQEKPDILFLQELGSVFSQSEEIAEKLGMSHTEQRTNCGTSVFGVGLPVNLNIGIAILVRPPLKIQKILGLKLSGPPGFCSSYLTFQYAEFRYALFALAYHPKYGSFLLVNTHLHHGVEWSAELREQIKTWESAATITSSEKKELEQSIEDSNQRRKSEIKALFDQINELKKYYDQPLPVILAGDFNSTVKSPVYQNIVETHKMKDSAQNYEPLPYTWNPAENQKNYEYSKKFGLSVPTFDKKEVEDFFVEYDRRARRIDYVFVSPDINIISHELFAKEPGKNGIIGSDHFGILVSLGVGEE